MNARSWRVRPAVAALPVALLVTLLCRSLAHGVGADELSLLTMAQSIHAGFFPYDEYWDVRPPLAYLWALPSAYIDDATRAVVALRLLAWLAQALAAWICFCLFRKTLGAVAAALGAFALVLAANATQLHMMAMPNHFSMTLSVVAFACLVVGRRGRSAAFVCSGLLAGLLPWVMSQAALVLLSFGLVALCSPACSWRQRLLWLTAAALPSLATFGAYLAWGPFETFLRTVFAAPLGVLDMRAGGGYRLFSAAELLRFCADSPWVVCQAALLMVGLAGLPGAARRAPATSALRLAPFLAAPLLLGYAALAYAKPPGPPEYVVDMAPALGLAIAVAASKALRWRGWTRPAIARHARAAVLRGCLAAVGAGLLAAPFDPWAKEPTPLPKTYCDAAVYWLQRTAPDATVLDAIGLCGFHLLDQGARLHPPFTFAPMWTRQFSQRWVGAALAGDGSPRSAAQRLRSALGADANSELILADQRLLGEIRALGWQQWLHQRWRLVWFQRIDGIEAGERFARMAILVRRPALGAPRRTIDDLVP